MCHLLLPLFCTSARVLVAAPSLGPVLSRRTARRRRVRWGPDASLPPPGTARLPRPAAVAGAVTLRTRGNSLDSRQAIACRDA